MFWYLPHGLILLSLWPVLQTDEEECKATKKGNGKKPKTCIFPFIWKSKEYVECTDKDGNKGPWCAVKVNKKTKVVKNKDRWICEPGCPVENGKIFAGKAYYVLHG